VVKSAAKVSIRDIFDGSQSDDEESDGYEVVTMAIEMGMRVTVTPMKMTHR
jgi:hypothetical protein